MSDITDRDRDAFHGSSSSSSMKQEVYSSNTNSTALNIAKVFLYMFAGLLISAIVAFGMGALVYYQILYQHYLPYPPNLLVENH